MTEFIETVKVRLCERRVNEPQMSEHHSIFYDEFLVAGSKFAHKHKISILSVSQFMRSSFGPHFSLINPNNNLINYDAKKKSNHFYANCCAKSSTPFSNSTIL